MENNEIRFRLMESTPPMNEPLLSDLGFLSDTNAAKCILNGTYICPEGVDAYTKNFIASLQITTPINPADFIPNMVSLQDYQAHWKRSKECTSSSISGQHFGHWKAAALISSPNSMLSSLTSSSPPVTLPSGGSKGYRLCLKRRRGYTYLPNSMPSY